MRDTVLVTGATGFIGRHLVAALASKNVTILCHSQADGDISRDPLTYPDIGHVFHLAGKTFVPESWERPFEFYAVNVLGTVNVLELCRSRAASLTLISSYVYGTPAYLPIREDHPVTAWNPYCQTKLMAEDVARYYARQFGVKVAIVRPFNIYGPGQDSRFLLPTLIAQMLDSSDEIRVADLRPKRDYLHVSDLVALLIAAFEKRAGGVFNAGSGTSVGIAELVQEISRAAGRDKPLRSEGRPREQEVLDTVADIAKARAELEWQPSVGLRVGIAGMVASMGDARGRS